MYHRRNEFVAILLTSFLIQLIFSFPTPNNNNGFGFGENQQNSRRGQRQRSQDPTNQGSSNKFTELNSQEGLAQGSGEAFSVHHNLTRQIRLVAEQKLRNVTVTPSQSPLNGTGGVELRICSLEPSYLCLIEPAQTQRNKARRIMVIQETVLDQVGRLNKAPTASTKISLTDGMTRSTGQVPSSPFSGELQTYYASCDLPNKVASEIWTMPGFFHLFFNVSSGNANSRTQQLRTMGGSNTNQYLFPVTVRQQGRPVNIISAKLRLYKIKRSTQINGDNITLSEPFNETILITDVEGENIMQSQMTKTSTTDEKIRISIYWYTMPATKHHYKKKLLDTKMVTLKDSEWIDFDIQKAVKTWLEKKLNYGLIIEVENEDNDLVDPNNYFSNVACPEALLFNSLDQDSNSTQPLETIDEVSMTNVGAPVLEICTLSITETDRQIAFPPFPVTSVRNQNHSYFRTNTKINDGFGWQNDGVTGESETITDTPRHRHRHHHGEDRRNQRHQSQSHNSVQQPPRNANTGNIGAAVAQESSVSNDHPLRSIFAHPFGKNRNQLNEKQSSSSPPQIQLSVSDDLDYSDLESTENDKDDGVEKIGIENIFVEPQLQQGSRRTR